MPYLVAISVSQTDTAFAAAPGQHLAAIRSRHALAESVDLAALTLFGLIGTNHFGTPPVLILAEQSSPLPQRPACAGRGRQSYHALMKAQMVLYLINKSPVNLLFRFFLFLFFYGPQYLVFLQK
jgi:hypothetical protein